MGRVVGFCRGRLLVTSIAAVVAVVAGASIATGAIPGGGGKISGCYEPRTGLLRVIDADAGRTCTRYEEAISWNQQGPPGADGVPGEKGEIGPQGPPGPEGTVDTSNFYDKTESDSRFRPLDTKIGANDLGADSVVGGKNGTVKDGTITDDDLASGLSGSKLAGGSVDKSKLVANAVAATGIPETVAVPGGGAETVVGTVQANINVAGTDGTKTHALMLSGQVQFGAVILPVGDIVSLHWRVFRGSMPVTPEYSTRLTTAMPIMFGSVAQVVHDATEGATETYTLKVAASTGGLGVQMDVTNGVLNVVDLGRTS